MLLLPVFALSIVAVATASLEEPSSIEPLVLNVTATHDLAPRATQTGISPIQCTLQLSTVQCCQTIEPLSAVLSILEPILAAADIPLPPLGTVVALNCQMDILGLESCAQPMSPLCCTLVVPNQNIGVDCQPAGPLL